MTSHVLSLQWKLQTKDTGGTTSINSAVVPFVRRLSSSWKFKGNQLFGTLWSVLCREVYYVMSLSQMVHYQTEVIATADLFLYLPNTPLLILELLQNYDTKGVHLVHSYLNLIQFGQRTKYDCMHVLQVTEVFRLRSRQEIGACMQIWPVKQALYLKSLQLSWSTVCSSLDQWRVCLQARHTLCTLSSVQAMLRTGRGSTKVAIFGNFCHFWQLLLTTVAKYGNLYELPEMEIPLRMNIFPFLVIHKIARHHTPNHHHHQILPLTSRKWSQFFSHSFLS